MHQNNTIENINISFTLAWPWNSMEIEERGSCDDYSRLHFKQLHILLFDAIDMANLKVIN